MSVNLGHLITAMITPFDEHNRVNYEMAVTLGNHLIKNGTDCILASGTTGECPTLTHEEEFLLFEVLVHELNVPIMAGTGSNCTATAISSTQKAESYGVAASLQVVPYYNKPTQEGIYLHFKAIAGNTALPILLYNIPGRTGVNMEPETMARLSEIHNIIGVKEASGDLAQVSKIRDLTGDNFLIYSGDDALTVPILERGGNGVVSVASHIAGLPMKEMILSFYEGDIDKADSMSALLNPLFKGLFETSNPILLKAAMIMMGFEVGVPRLPLIEATHDEKVKLRALLEASNIPLVNVN